MKKMLSGALILVSIQVMSATDINISTIRNEDALYNQDSWSNADTKIFNKSIPNISFDEINNAIDVLQKEITQSSDSGKKESIDKAIQQLRKLKNFKEDQDVKENSINEEIVKKIIEAESIEKNSDSSLTASTEAEKKESLQNESPVTNSDDEKKGPEGLIILGGVVLLFLLAFMNWMSKPRCPNCNSRKAKAIGKEEVDRWKSTKKVHEQTAAGNTKSRNMYTTMITIRHHLMCKKCTQEFCFDIDREK